MSIRRKIVAANWKMNLLLDEGKGLVSDLLNNLGKELSCDVIIAPPLPYISVLRDIASGSALRFAAQNCYFEKSGAFTGEVSAEMIGSVGATHCITGHSERRQYFQESNEVVKRKVDAILAFGLTPIFCCGESLDIREAGEQNDFVRRQLEESIFHLDPVSFSKLVIAYEPIWAIGTGVTATPEQAQEMHAFIRNSIRAAYGDEISDQVQILYGGSVKGDNAASIFSQPDVDGGLVGGASLQSKGFMDIVRAACG